MRRNTSTAINTTTTTTDGVSTIDAIFKRLRSAWKIMGTKDGSKISSEARQSVGGQEPLSLQLEARRGR